MHHCGRDFLKDVILPLKRLARFLLELYVFVLSGSIHLCRFYVSAVIKNLPFVLI